MSPNAPLDVLARKISRLNRTQCIAELRDFREIPLDFNDTFLNAMSLEKLRHVLMAACLTARKYR